MGKINDKINDWLRNQWKKNPKRFIIIFIIVSISFGVICAKLTEVREEVSKKELVKLQISDSGKQLAISQIKMDSCVKDATIKQNGKTVKLGILVKYKIIENAARELADNFVRLVIALGGVENSPGKKIGKSKLDYEIFVFTEHEQIFHGLKESFRDSLYW